MRSRRQNGFTLVELLVVIGIIALLISVLLPSLNKARESANTLKCASNLRTIGQGIAMYVANAKGSLPQAYLYDGMTIQNGVQLPAAAANGYLHWSGLIYNPSQSGSTGPAGIVAACVFQCPSLDKGGLPPTNTTPENNDTGQIPETAGVTDKQASRMAYTVNEALLPRNKFTLGFQGAIRTEWYIKAGTVRNPANNIMATEFINDWRIVSDAPRTGGTSAVCKSHRPVHGFVATAGAGPGALNFEKVAPGATYRKVTYADLDPTAPLTYDPSTTRSRLDWVGRNHGTGRYELKKTNFLYVDGHVETKHIKDTLEPFQWGDRFYTLQPQDGLQ